MHHLPACSQHTIYVGLGFQDIRRLSMVGRSWVDTGRSIQEKIVAAAKVFCDRKFPVDALGELFKSAENKERRLRTLMKKIPNHFRTKWWYEAQLHLHVFCQRNVSSVVDIARRVFEYEPICEAHLFEQVFYVVLHNQLQIDYGDLLAVPIPINPRLFCDRAFVTTRDLGCVNLSAPATWYEVLLTLLCLVRGLNYCSIFCGCNNSASSPSWSPSLWWWRWLTITYERSGKHCTQVKYKAALKMTPPLKHCSKLKNENEI